ncbi:hypothetical protein KP509_20G047700 [Ceratopteris richardii]|uniref:Dynein axonemal assembly factor 11-like CS domain-containing protein n=1 Tax=Ceratopteris richardii TaxID=49495 RepID=A0A8T2SH71_CERRI|nr:hypothetical protein KP509_20G047700 [Ceratopteris richardii]
MVGITEEMLKRRAEHNDGVLHSLEELVLQEEGLDRIEKILGTLCPHLKHLYMPNNLIPRIENLHRLKELQYLNLALNNITKIEGLEQCECLEKLDLTLNFLGQNELQSISKLSHNPSLKDLYLTGNPCQDFPGYRFFVIFTVPSLKRLDGVEVKPSERICAKQMFKSILEKLNNNINTTTEDISVNGETTINEKGQTVREYTPATRLAEHAELEEMRRVSKGQKEVSSLNPKKSQRHSGFDPLPSEGRIYQKNEGGWNFRLSESECKSKVLLDVPVGRYMDISLIDVDVQPTWVRVLVKGKLLQLMLPDEVNPDTSIAQRSNTTGNLLICMPKATCNSKINMQKPKTSSLFYSEGPKEPNKIKAKRGNDVHFALEENNQTETTTVDVMDKIADVTLEAPTNIGRASNALDETLGGFDSIGVQEFEQSNEVHFDDLPALE